MANTDGSGDSCQSRPARDLEDLEDEVERYRRASEDALQQLDWCIGYFHGCGKTGIARGLANNRSHIRQHLLKRSEQAVPTQTAQPANG